MFTLHLLPGRVPLVQPFLQLASSYLFTPLVNLLGMLVGQQVAQEILIGELNIAGMTPVLLRDQDLLGLITCSTRGAWLLTGNSR